MSLAQYVHELEEKIIRLQRELTEARRCDRLRSPLPREEREQILRERYRRSIQD